MVEITIPDTDILEGFHALGSCQAGSEYSVIFLAMLLDLHNISPTNSPARHIQLSMCHLDGVRDSSQ